MLTSRSRDKLCAYRMTDPARNRQSLGVFVTARVVGHAIDVADTPVTLRDGEERCQFCRVGDWWETGMVLAEVGGAGANDRSVGEHRYL